MADEMFGIREALIELKTSHQELVKRFDRHMDLLTPRIEKWDATTTKVNLAMSLIAGAWAALLAIGTWVLSHLGFKAST